MNILSKMLCRLYVKYRKKYENTDSLLQMQVPTKTGDTWTDIDIESYLFGKYAAAHFYSHNTEQFDIIVHKMHKGPFGV